MIICSCNVLSDQQVRIALDAGNPLRTNAAWTASEPRGAALATRTSTGWHLVAAEASYERFYARAEGLPRGRPSGSRPRPSALLASALKLCGRPVDLVAIDMPLPYAPIMGRRTADDDPYPDRGKHSEPWKIMAAAAPAYLEKPRNRESRRDLSPSGSEPEHR